MRISRSCSYTRLTSIFIIIIISSSLTVASKLTTSQSFSFDHRSRSTSKKPMMNTNNQILKLSLSCMILLTTIPQPIGSEKVEIVPTPIELNRYQKVSCPVNLDIDDREDVSGHSHYGYASSKSSIDHLNNQSKDHKPNSYDQDSNYCKGRDEGERSRQSDKKLIRFLMNSKGVLTSKKNPINLIFRTLRALVKFLVLSVLFQTLLLNGLAFINLIVLTIWDRIIHPVLFPFRLVNYLFIVSPYRVIRTFLRKNSPVFSLIFLACVFGIMVGFLTISVYNKVIGRSVLYYNQKNHEFRLKVLSKDELKKLKKKKREGKRLIESEIDSGGNGGVNLTVIKKEEGDDGYDKDKAKKKYLLDKNPSKILDLLSSKKLKYFEKFDKPFNDDAYGDDQGSNSNSRPAPSPSKEDSPPIPFLPINISSKKRADAGNNNGKEEDPDQKSFNSKPSGSIIKNESNTKDEKVFVSSSSSVSINPSLSSSSNSSNLRKKVTFKTD